MQTFGRQDILSKHMQICGKNQPNQNQKSENSANCLLLESKKYKN